MKLKLVDNEPKYYEFIRLTRIHPENIGGFINQSNITEKEQIEYMEKNQNFFFLCVKLCLKRGSCRSRRSCRSPLPLSHYSSHPSLTKKIIINNI